MALDSISQIRGWDFELIGEVWVDSGQIMAVDPCYVLGDPSSPATETYQQVLDAYDEDHTQTNIEPWGRGLGLVFSTLYGDGGYKVYARKVNGGNAQILIDFEQLDD